MRRSSSPTLTKTNGASSFPVFDPANVAGSPFAFLTVAVFAMQPPVRMHAVAAAVRLKLSYVGRYACCTTWSQLKQRYTREAANAAVSCRSAKCLICAPQSLHSRVGTVGAPLSGVDFTPGASIHSKGGFQSPVFLGGPARRNQGNETCVRRFSPT